MALGKPAAMRVGPDLLAASAPDLLAAVKAALAAGKRQLLNLRIAHVGRVHSVEAAASGAVILAVTPEAEVRLRNAAGSRRWEFVYDVIAQNTGAEQPAPLTCDLPLASHASEPRVVVSHASGKKCKTVFTPVQALGRWTLWEARTRENRPHQIRIHAHECGLHVPGDFVYGRTRRILLSQLKRGYRPGRDEERPLYAHPCLHVREIMVAAGPETVVGVQAPRPRTFEVLLRRLEAAAGPRLLRL